jgi:hypothetical protein
MPDTETTRCNNCGPAHGEIVANLGNLNRDVCSVNKRVHELIADRLSSYKEISRDLSQKTSLKLFMWVTAGLAALILVLNALQWDSTRASTLIEKTVSEKMAEMKADLAVIKEQVSKINSNAGRKQE